ARVEVRQLLDGRWRVYSKDQLLLETTPAVVQAPLRTVRRRRRTTKNSKKNKTVKAITRNDRIRSRLKHDLRKKDNQNTPEFGNAALWKCLLNTQHRGDIFAEQIR